MREDLLSFGRYPRIEQRMVSLDWRDQGFPKVEGSILPRGNGLSYGDSCLAPTGGTLLDVRRLNRLIGFDATTGCLRCEAGVTLDSIIRALLPRGWLPPVLPGTRDVTVGGAIANDIHGKNHHRRGSFGDSVLAFELLRSDGSRPKCSPQENAELFAATIGGLGLTGIITAAEIALLRVPGPWLDVDTLHFAGVSEFLALARESEATHEYTVAWFDCLSAHAGDLRGVFLRANHADSQPNATLRNGWRPGIPFTPPWPLVGGVALRAFNALYRAAQRPGRRPAHFSTFFFPLDRVRNWNRLYGPGGLVQYQCVVPPAAALAELLERIARTGCGSFLAVLKTFGTSRGRGLLSFARPGATLALDFPAGARTFALLDTLDAVVADAAGAVYPAKDARMAAGMFRRFYPQWKQLETSRDPAIQSAFWQRVAHSEAL